MKTMICVMNGDDINRYGYRFTTGALERNLRETEGGMSMNLNHDMTMPIGWMRPLALYLEPGLGRIAGIAYLCENNKETEQVMIAHENLNIKRMKKEFEPWEKEFLGAVGAFLKGDEKRLVVETIAMEGPGLARRAFPELFKLADKDGLVPLSALETKAPGVFNVGKSGEFCVFAHRYFRRSQYIFNSLNEAFLKEFQKLKKEYGDKAKIAIDENLVGYTKAYRSRLELQYWRGPKFDEEVTSVPDGVTVHGASEADRTINNILRTEFGWFDQGGKRSFVCEEIRDSNTVAIGGDKLACRYVHSMVVPSEKRPDHLDGAVRIYAGQEIEERKKVDLKSVERTSEYKKLWRVDGAIPISLWKSLIGDYFRDNPLVTEYFGKKLGYETEGVVGEAVEPVHTFDYPVPPLSDKKGVRISISYGPKPEVPKTGDGVFICSPDSLSDEAKTIRTVEDNAFEIVKCLRRAGIKVSIATDMQVMKFHDNVVNCPVIECAGPQARVKYEACCVAIGEYLAALNEKKRCLILVLNFEVELETTILSLSIAGSGNDIAAWLSSNHFCLPKVEDDLADWSEANRNWLTNTYPSSDDQPALSKILKNNGKIYLDRAMLKRIDYTFKRTDGGLNVEFCVPKESIASEEEFFKRCRVAPVLFVSKSSCSKCEKPYETCLHSKFIEDDVLQVIENAVPFSCFFTWPEG